MKGDNILFKLKKLNVIRIVESEEQKAKLIAEGFKEVIKKEEKKTTKK